MSFQLGSIWFPTCLNSLVLKADKHWQAAYFPGLVNMYHCPISNVDTRRHPRKSTILLPSLSELALMLLSGVLYLPPRQREWYDEMVRVAPFRVTSVSASCSWVQFKHCWILHVRLLHCLTRCINYTKYQCDFVEDEKVFFFSFSGQCFAHLQPLNTTRRFIWNLSPLKL